MLIFGEKFEKKVLGIEETCKMADEKNNKFGGKKKKEIDG
jgi:hypothetical protein